MITKIIKKYVLNPRLTMKFDFFAAQSHGKNSL